MGLFSWSEPQQNDSGGNCVAPSNSYTVKDHYTFKWSEKLSFPGGIGTFVQPKDYKAGGTDVTDRVQGTCTNGFGNILGGDSYSCTQKWNPLPSSDTEYPTVVTAGHFKVMVTGGIQQSGPLTGTNCIGASVGGALYSYTFEKLKGATKFSSATLEHKGSVSKSVGASTKLSCSGTSCDHDFCKNDLQPGPVPVTCSTNQSFTAKLEVQLVK
jgi:hypothetical protein